MVHKDNIIFENIQFNFLIFSVRFNKLAGSDYLKIEPYSELPDFYQS